MPIIQVTLIEGRDDETIEGFMKAVAKTASDTLNAPMESVRVIVNQVAPNRFAVGDRLKSEK